MAYIFLDESGQFTTDKNNDYFVVGSFITANPRRIETRFRSWQRNKFPRKLRNQAEIKWSEVKITDDLRFRTLKYIADLDVRIHFTYLKRKNIPDEYRTNKRLESGLLYTHVIGETLDLYLPSTEKEFRVFCDHRHLKGVRHTKFRQILHARLLPKLPPDSVVQIEMIDSTSNINIQIADWITGALTAYVEKKPMGEICYAILKNNMLGKGNELFKDYWQYKYQKTQLDS